MLNYEVLIRPAFDEDMVRLYDHAFASGTLWHRVAGDSLPRPGDFAAVVDYRIVMQFVIEVAGDFAGCCALLDHDPAAETMWMEVVPVAGADRSVAPTAGWTMLQRAFGDWQVRKVYLTQHGCEPVPFVDLPVKWEEEGRLSEFHRHGAGFCDAVVLTVDRNDAPDDWEAAWLSD